MHPMAATPDIIRGHYTQDTTNPIAEDTVEERAMTTIMLDNKQTQQEARRENRKAEC